jgi:hypothetical protein
MFGLIEYPGDLLLGQNHTHYGQPPPEVSFNHDSNAGKSSRALLGGDFNGCDAGVPKQRIQFATLAEDERCTQGIAGSPASQAVQQGHLRGVSGNVVEQVPHRDSQTPPGSQDPEHLAHCLPAIREKHEPKLADDCVE